jgi:hypothetical protein
VPDFLLALVVLASLGAGATITALAVVARRQAATHARMRDTADAAASIVDRLGREWADVLADALARQVLVLVVERTHQAATDRMHLLAEVIPDTAVRAVMRANGSNRIILESGSRILFTSGSAHGLGRGYPVDHVMMHAAVSEDARLSLVAATASRGGVVHYLSPVHA